MWDSIRGGWKSHESPSQKLLAILLPLYDRERHDRAEQTENCVNPPITEAEIREHFVESARGEPCHLCGSPYGFRVEFMGRASHPHCVQQNVESPKHEYNKHGAYES